MGGDSSENVLFTFILGFITVKFCRITTFLSTSFINTLWLAYRYRDRKFSHNSTGTGSRMADCSGTGTGIDLEDLRVPVKRVLLVMRSQCTFHDGRGITSSTFLRCGRLILYV